MANTFDIAPSLGHGAITTQAGVGTSPGYDAIDDRRFWMLGLKEGILSLGSYAVTERGAGANMTVEVAATTGDGLVIQGDAVAVQGRYYIAPHSDVENVDISDGDAADPRNDLVIVQVMDDTHDSLGSNKARCIVLEGTPNAAATKTDAPGANGTPALPSSSIPLAVVNVPATEAVSIGDNDIDDRRPRHRGAVAIPGEESTGSATYVKLATPDEVRNIVLPADGLIVVAYRAHMKSTPATGSRAAIFIGSNQLKSRQLALVGTQAADNNTAAVYETLFTLPMGLATASSPTDTPADVTTGETIGQFVTAAEEGSTAVGGTFNVYYPTTQGPTGGVCYIFAAAGTYDVSVQFLTSSTTVLAKERKLWVWAMDFDQLV